MLSHKLPCLRCRVCSAEANPDGSPVSRAAVKSASYSDMTAWWETAQHEKVSRGRRSNLPEGVKSRASVMLLDEEWERLHAAKGDATIVDFVREAVLAVI